MAAHPSWPHRVNSAVAGRWHVSWRGPLLCLCLVNVYGCMQHGQPLIADRSPILQDQDRLNYVVRKGDTLYSIAWRFELDYQGLARANGIRAPYLIRSGQKLRLTTQLPLGSRVRTGRTSSKPAPGRASASSSVSVDSSWRWPLQQQPVVEFGGASKGMDFHLAQAHATVLAAGGGEVVYAGNGIGGYEHLVIIKHSQTLLSAYSFDGQLRVREQQRLKTGEEIALIRRRGGAQQALHFELRRNGKPINPRSLLR